MPSFKISYTKVVHKEVEAGNAREAQSFLKQVDPTCISIIKCEKIK